MMMLMIMLMLILFFYKYKYWEMFYLLLMISFIFLFKMNLVYYINNINYLMGWDQLSYMLILLSFWISSLMILASEVIYKKKNHFNLFNFMVLILLLFLYLTFSFLNIFMFYIFFEASLIPLLLLIFGWGYQPERIQAGVYLFFYTLFASLPMMIYIFYMYTNFYLMDFFFLNNFMIDNLMFFIFVNLVFFIKMPMFIVHLWLPKAHVEAPIAGSMILAGVMLKLGGYGLMRFLILFMNLGMKINYFFVTISLLGGALISIYCSFQNDLKSLIAYSSVSHMSLVISGLLSMNLAGFMGSFFMMIAHGLCSSGLFCLANLNYERLNSRSIYLNKGLMILMPSLSLWWFLFSACNMAAPPSLNLLSEIILLISIISYSKFLIMFLIFMSFFSAVYSLFLFSFTQHGQITLFQLFNFITLREYLLVISHFIPLIFLILKSDLFYF